MKVLIKKLHHDSILPEYKHDGDSGMDLYSYVNQVILVGETKLIPTGIAVSIPKGYEAQVRSRSGLASKNSVFTLNSPGTIDSNYRGEISGILMNLGSHPYVVKKGDRIAQLVFAKVETVELEETESLDETVRGEKGFGSTGV